MFEEDFETNWIRSYEDAMAAWDKVSVIVRTELDSKGDDVVYVYPLLGRGYSYHGFSLRHEACLQTFRSVDQAMMWSRSRGYDATRIN